MMTCIRRLTAQEVAVAASHRVRMFADIKGGLPNALADALYLETLEYLRVAVPKGEYVGWLASPDADPKTIIGGAGAQLRRVLPFPTSIASSLALAVGREAIVLDVYTAPAWRRLGVARTIMHSVLEWARTEHLDSLVLHPSVYGRPLYDALGFVPTNELRYPSDLLAACGHTDAVSTMGAPADPPSSSAYA